MRGRSRGHQERIIIAAYQGEVFARTKTLNPLGKYLETPKPAKTGSSAVLAMLRRMKAKQDARAKKPKTEE